MGQFLGFSYKHLMTVALVKNLHTDFISPQYHMVFDDKLKTIFHIGKSTEELDKICNELFVESHNCYVEEGYDEDGVLIYKPPPLDEVWLLEPECQECKVELEKQRDRHSCLLKNLNTCEIKQRLDESWQWKL
ncbi:hypothetical protein ACHAW6_002814 [Cyclotella cf. meneghiniana]